MSGYIKRVSCEQVAAGRGVEAATDCEPGLFNFPNHATKSNFLYLIDIAKPPGHLCARITETDHAQTNFAECG